MGSYAKAFVALVGAVAVGLVAVVTDSVVTPLEAVNLALAGLGAFAVYLTPNVAGFPAAKATMLALTAGLTYLASALSTDADLNWALWAQVIATGVAAVVAYLAPNKPEVTA